MNPGKSILVSLRNVYETLSIAAPTLIDAARGSLSREICDDRLESWASHVVANTEMMITVQGREHVEQGRTYVVMSNHQSHYDVAVIFYVLGSDIRMVAKRELFSIPVFGPALRVGGFISVDRQNRESAIASLEGAKAHLAAGVPIWIAPEGTRSMTGELLPFKKGGFVLAAETGTPILPVTIRGTRDALPAKGLRSRRGVEVLVTIHPPVDPRRFTAPSEEGDPKASRDVLAETVRQAIASAL